MFVFSIPHGTYFFKDWLFKVERSDLSLSSRFILFLSMLSYIFSSLLYIWYRLIWRRSCLNYISILSELMTLMCVRPCCVVLYAWNGSHSLPMCILMQCIQLTLCTSLEMCLEAIMLR